MRCAQTGAGIRVRGPSAGSLTAAAPFLLALAPKCPLCALPLLAAVGVAAPSGPVLDGIVAAAAILWLAVVFARWRSTAFRAGAVTVALALVSGRLLGCAWMSAAACAGMLCLVLSRFRRNAAGVPRRTASRGRSRPRRAWADALRRGAG